MINDIENLVPKQPADEGSTAPVDLNSTSSQLPPAVKPPVSSTKVVPSLSAVVTGNKLSVAQPRKSTPGTSGSNVSDQFRQPPMHSAPARQSLYSVGDIIEDGIRIESQYDAVSESKFRDVNDRLDRVNRAVGSLETRILGAENVGGTLGELKYELSGQISQNRADLVEHDRALTALEEQQNRQARSVLAIQEHLNMEQNELDAQLEAIRSDITTNVIEYEQVSTALRAEQGDKKPLEAEVKRLSGLIDASARELLALKVEQVLSPIQSTQPIQQITAIQAQLLEITRKKLTSQAPATRWSAMAGLFSTDKETQALRSVQRLSKNPAFSKLEQRNDADLAVNANILSLMVHATYALTYFNASHAPAATSSPVSTAAAASAVVNTPVRTSAPISTLVGTPSSARQTLAEADVVNRAVLLAVREDLKTIQTREEGLIGTQSPSRQFWGKVLMTLALAIAATVAAIALMSALGFALPTFLVPYIAYVQASAIVSSVLNLVSAKLAVDLTTAAVVTAAATAGTFGVFGYGLNKSGAPTNLKKDLDRAAQDLDSAIANTPAMRATR